MIEIIIDPQDVNLFTEKTDIGPIIDSFMSVLKIQGLFHPYINLYSIIPESHGRGFLVEFPGITCLSDDDQNYFCRGIVFFIHEAGLSDLIFLRNVSFIRKPNDLIFERKNFQLEKTVNAQLMDSYQVKDDEIPEKFLCALSTQLMDNPIYIKDKPDIFYDKNKFLKNYLWIQPQFLDPFRQVEINLSDIISDTELKKEIDGFKTKIIQQKLFNKKNLAKKQSTPLTINSPITASGDASDHLIKTLEVKLGSKKNQYGTLFDALNAKNYSQALRRACTCTDLDIALEVAKTILDYKKILNIKINEAAGKENKTALHHAAFLGNIALHNLLITEGADRTLKDTYLKTPDDYMQDYIMKSLKTNCNS